MRWSLFRLANDSLDANVDIVSTLYSDVRTSFTSSAKKAEIDDTI
jgi:hypothetical protein